MTTAVSVIACRRGQKPTLCTEPGCKRDAIQGCTYPLMGDKAGQPCGRPLCGGHGIVIGDAGAYCPAHHKDWRAAQETPR